MDGDVIWDSISNLDLYVTQGSVLTGAVVDDESCAGNGGSGTANVTIDADSKWVVTGDSTLTNLACEGEIVDAAGNAVSVVGTDGAVYVQGDSEYTVTAGNYAETCDLTGAGEITGMGRFRHADVTTSFNRNSHNADDIDFFMSFFSPTQKAASQRGRFLPVPQTEFRKPLDIRRQTC